MASWCDGMAAAPRVLVAPRPSDANCQGNVLSLRHPKSDEETGYLFVDGKLHEFNWFKEHFGSWFLGDYVCEDGSLYYCTLVDPIFILLPILKLHICCFPAEVADVKFFRLDNSKVLSWLCCKVHNLKEVFPKLGKNYAAQGEKEICMSL
ncbi:hypothetical protein GUJ93_ZPchr0004g38742 [Zizania palustris]|uniref:Rnh202 triple barrel domain-containing protein n=1 Tax=Zizania palustris TaxID=103762 RepID=A0A8J5VYP2_ZIZPA|nr:hypothetical protein GUJ93_ZPchr0004g38742 [Zizania palustris]